MVKLTKIYTRTGDLGQSGLVGGNRRSKSDHRFSAIGDVDETNAAIGLSLSLIKGTDPHHALLQAIQNDLFDLGADLATPEAIPGALRIESRAVSKLETNIDELSHALGPLTSFVLPGGTEQSARLHLARSIARRSERTMVALNEIEPLNPEALKYINRLSDLLFQLARAYNDGGASDVLWQPGNP